MSITNDMSPDIVKIIQELRRSLIDSFLSIVNGIAKPEDDNY